MNILVAMVLIMSTIFQYVLFIKCFKYCIVEKQVIDNIERLINRKFDDLYNKQNKYLTDKYWTNVARKPTYIDGNFLYHIDYNINKRQLEGLIESYLNGNYDKEIADPLGNFLIYMCRSRCELDLAEECKDRAVFVDNIAYTNLKLKRCFEDDNKTLNQNVLMSGTYDCISLDDWYRVLKIYLSECENVELFPRYKNYMDDILNFLISSRFYKCYTIYPDKTSKSDLTDMLMQKSIKLLYSYQLEQSVAFYLLKNLSRLCIDIRKDKTISCKYEMRYQSDKVFLTADFSSMYNVDMESFTKNLNITEIVTEVYEKNNVADEDDAEDLNLF